MLLALNADRSDVDGELEQKVSDLHCGIRKAELRWIFPSGKMINGIKRVAIVPRTTAAIVMIACVVVIVISPLPPSFSC